MEGASLGQAKKTRAWPGFFFDFVGILPDALRRDIEIVVVDGERGMGNGWLLPAGPLREAPARARRAHMLIFNGGNAEAAYAFELQLQAAINLVSGEHRELSAFRGQSAHAIAGIGNPPRFFNHLAAAGVVCSEHAFPDHFRYSADDLAFGDEAPVLMTEKDAVKCEAFAKPHWWYVPVTLVDRDDRIAEEVLRLLHENRR